MESRNIVRKAWQMTQTNLKKLIWYGAVPAFFSIIVSSAYLAYQYNAFRHSKIFNPEADENVVNSFGTIFDLVKEHSTMSIILVVLTIIILACYVLVPPIFNGILIAAVTRVQDYKELDGVAEIGVRRFFPMFEFSALMGSFSITTLFTEGSFILRWWGFDVFFVVLPVLLFVSIIGFIISILFTYAEFYIVLHDKSVIKAIGNSCVLVIANLRKTILILILMVLIGARILLNVLLVLFIPMIIVALTGYFATIKLAWVGIALSAIIGLGLSGLAAYLLGLFHIFSTAVWVLTFKELTQKNTSASGDRETSAAENALADDVASAPDAATPSSHPQIAT